MSGKNESDISVDAGSRGNANLIYILYLVSVIVGLTSVIGLIMAYVGRGDADSLTKSHYDNQIGIFWKAFLFFIVGFITSVFIIGFLILPVALVWYLVRTITGMQALSKGQAISNPGSWGFTA